MGCVDMPTPLEPLAIECAVCDGVGCDNCSGGQKLYTSCPKKQVSNDIIYTASLSTSFDNGLMPESGGLNDQDSKFVNTMFTLKNNETHFEKGN